MSRNLLTTIAIAGLLIFAVCLKGCGGYGAVNQATFQYAKALYAVCNRKDPEGLQKTAEMIESASASEEISSREAKWLTDIVKTAQSNEWENAMLMARDLMSDQADD